MAKKIFQLDEETIRNGKRIRLVGHITDIDPKSDSYLFLERYKISLIAYDIENVENKILLDVHTGKFLHIHLDGKETLIQDKVKTPDDVIDFFFDAVIEKDW